MMETDIRNVKISDSFWSERQRTISDVTLPYMERILRDEIEGIEKSHALTNFRIAAGLEQGEYYGMVFQDSDVAKWLEAASYSLAVKYDPDLDRRVDEVIETVRLAQWDDGYLNTYFTLVDPEHRWQNLLECHELYCAGHMIEAGVAHYQCTGKETLLNVVKKQADNIIDVFGEGKQEGIPGHEEIELALMRLYHVTGEKKYLDMAVRFLDLRGKDENFFVKEKQRSGMTKEIFGLDPAETVYNQSDVPVREQTKPRGHAVRQMYLLAAMADEAASCDDKEMADACRRMFDAIVNRQMYVTGSLGSTHEGEAFSVDYHLPADTIYGETCAAVAMAFFAKNMLSLEADGKYADILELEIYNGALSGMQLDGKRFFYVNPLDVEKGISGQVPGHRHVLPQRPAWYGCACCPPNLARLIESMGKYIFSEDGTTIYNHLFIGSTADLHLAKVTVSTGYPWNGGAEYTVEPKTEDEFTLALHIPGYVENFTLSINGEVLPCQPKKGYVYISRKWESGDKVTLDFDIEPRVIYGNPRLRDCAGRVAVACGPVVYCMESCDNGGIPLHAATIDTQEIRKEQISDPVLGNVTILRAKGTKDMVSEELYSCKVPTAEDAEFTLIPYYAWGNRGENDMLVWMRKK